MKFSDLTFNTLRDGGGAQAVADFPNGYTASVIRGPHTYGGDRGLYELAVLRRGRLVYNTPITDDVLGYLSEADVTEALARVAALPPQQTGGSAERQRDKAERERLRDAGL